MEALRIREGTDADTEFFRELEMQTTWENLPPDDCQRLTQDQVWLALEETHQILMARPGHVFFMPNEVPDRIAGGDLAKIELPRFDPTARSGVDRKDHRIIATPLLQKGDDLAQCDTIIGILRTMQGGDRVGSPGDAQWTGSIASTISSVFMVPSVKPCG